MSKNLILTSGNQNLEITNFLDIPDRGSIVGLPLGTSDGTSTGELAVKTTIVGASAVIFPTNLATSANQATQITAEQAILAVLKGSLLPYNADEQDFTYVGSTNNIDTILFKKATVLQKTRTFTYVGGAPSTNDALIATTVDS